MPSKQLRDPKYRPTEVIKQCQEKADQHILQDLWFVTQSFHFVSCVAFMMWTLYIHQ